MFRVLCGVFFAGISKFVFPFVLPLPLVLLAPLQTKQESVIRFHIHILAFKTFKMARELKNDESGLPFQILPESYLSQILNFPIAKLTLKRFGKKLKEKDFFASTKQEHFPHPW